MSKPWLRTALVGGVALAAACSAAARAPTGAPSGQAAVTPRIGAGELPTAARWIAHLEDELMPFWMTPDALGEPTGNFPTFRCNDGTRYRAEAPCAELGEAGSWITSELGREYTRMKSRQAFTYGVAYHVTGQERYLRAARAGVEWLRANAYDRATGSAVSYWQNGVAWPPPRQRTTQDLAYAQVGLAFYYYLTRDPAVLDDLARLEKHVMSAYWDGSPAPAGGQLRWVLEDGATPGDNKRQELVAQLDQINAYLLLVTPLIEDPVLAATWRRDVLTLARVIKERYFASEHGMFWGTLHDPAQKRLGGRHTDFGHSIKALWMLYLVGQTFGERELEDFARPHVAPLLSRAAQSTGCWASGYRGDGTLDAGSQWWVAAELDQAAATLALRAPAENGRAPEAYLRYLPASYRCWLERFVDPNGKEVWPFLPPDFRPEQFAAGGPPKAFHWKNGYHAAEHALVALLTTAGLRGEPVTLFYAFAREPVRAHVQPYYFRGEVLAERDHALVGALGLRGKAVTFSTVR